MKKFPISSNSMSYNISIFKTKLSMLMLASLSDVSKLSSIGSVIYVPYLYMFIYIMAMYSYSTDSYFIIYSKRCVTGVSILRYIGISIPIKYSNFGRFYKKLGLFYKNSDVISLVIDQSQPKMH